MLVQQQGAPNGYVPAPRVFLPRLPLAPDGEGLIEKMSTDSLSSAAGTVFGMEQFRDTQPAIMEAVLAGMDVLVVAPTGSGKVSLL